MNKVFTKPCPICKLMIFITGKDKDGYSLASCGHRFRFKKTKSNKILDRKFVVRPWGLERL